MITYSQKSRYVAAAIKAAREQLELIYPSVGQSDRLFPFQGRLCAAGQELERLGKEISAQCHTGTYVDVPIVVTPAMKVVIDYAREHRLSDYDDGDEVYDALCEGLIEKSQAEYDEAMKVIRGHTHNSVEVPDEEPLPAKVMRNIARTDGFLLFAWASYCEGGGALDYRSSYQSLRDALAYLEKEESNISEWNIFDVSLKRIVACHACSDINPDSKAKYQHHSSVHAKG